MFVTKKKYNESQTEVATYREIAYKRICTIEDLEKSLKYAIKDKENANKYAEQMQLNNCKLVTEKFETDKAIEQLEEANNNLHQEQVVLEEKIKELKFCLEECKRDNTKLLTTVKLTKAFRQQLEAICEDRGEVKFNRDNLLDIIKLLG